MSETATTEERAKNQINAILATAQQVILNPGEFFRAMPKSGGFGDPLFFLVVLAAVTGVMQAVLTLVQVRSVGMAIGMIFMMPIAAAIFGFVGAAILFVIWKLMGSLESYETAYRCGAYLAATMPITTVLSLIPYAGALLGLAWMVYLVVGVRRHRRVARDHVHLGPNPSPADAPQHGRLVAADARCRRRDRRTSPADGRRDAQEHGAATPARVEPPLAGRTLTLAPRRLG
jgi:hypothetical protein